METTKLYEPPTATHNRTLEELRDEIFLTVKNVEKNAHDRLSEIKEVFAHRFRDVIQQTTHQNLTSVSRPEQQSHGHCNERYAELKHKYTELCHTAQSLREANKQLKIKTECLNQRIELQTGTYVSRKRAQQEYILRSGVRRQASKRVQTDTVLSDYSQTIDKTGEDSYARYHNAVKQKTRQLNNLKKELTLERQEKRVLQIALDELRHKLAQIEIAPQSL